ncbi:GNAT family N-acetyltransferase [Mucilaginibacter gynuensis]|uniref:GNAT family N-acetyltransferase n=1 Tax=Mucilaginibacter gynuensis TaxID=1302236 RepID=A0ABP8G9C6_9SPHI
MDTVQVFKHFNELTPTELYEMLRLRSEIFVVEQNCIFLDMDNKDQKCHHLLLYKDDQLVAYARVVPAGISYPEASIGRIVTGSTVRGTGMGKILVQAAIDACFNLYGNQTIRIGAQLYAKKFYEGLGFVEEGEIYDEDGIDHVEMILDPAAK